MHRGSRHERTKKNYVHKSEVGKKNPQRINLGFIKFKRGIHVKHTLYFFNSNDLTIMVVLIPFVANFKEILIKYQ